MRRLSGSIVLAILVVPLGLASLWIAYGPGHAADFVPWLAVGWACVLFGLISRRVAPWSLEGALLVAAGIVWLIPDLSGCLNVEPLAHRCVAPGASPEVAAAIAWLWFGLLGHAVVAFPGGRPANRLSLVAVMAVYVLSVAIALGSAWARPVAAALLIAIPLIGSVVPRDGDAPGWMAPTIAGTSLAAAVLLDPGTGHALDTGAVVASLSLLFGLVTIARSRAALTADRAVELGPALAGVLGDATFRISVRAPDNESWLDAPGLAMPGAGADGARTTSIVRDGVEIARLSHDGSSLADAEISRAVVTAVELEAHNARLRADLEAQAEALAGSRRRLVDAGLREREALGRQVEVNVQRRLDLLAQTVQGLPTEGMPTEAIVRLRRAAGAISEAKSEVADLARGVYPPALADRGLVGALRELAAAAPIGVRVEAGDDATGGADVDATLYFVCAEAVANAVRHTTASSVEIEVNHADGVVTARIEDDGAGGADLEMGTGLRGLRDRVQALGGSLEIVSPPGSGTRLVATVPVGHEAH